MPTNLFVRSLLARPGSSQRALSVFLARRCNLTVIQPRLSRHFASQSPDLQQPNAEQDRVRKMTVFAVIGGALLSAGAFAAWKRNNRNASDGKTPLPKEIPSTATSFAASSAEPVASKSPATTEGEPTELPPKQQSVKETSRREHAKKADPSLPKLDIPEHVSYVIVGAGTAGLAAARAVRAKDPYAQVMLIGEEKKLPYMRPPLSKELWWTDDQKAASGLLFKMWNGKERSIFFEKEQFFCRPVDLPMLENGGVAAITGRKVIRVDPRHHMCEFDNGQTLFFDKCLIATGGTPRDLPVFKTMDTKGKVSKFRTIEDFKLLHEVTNKASSIAVVGGGFLGTELSCALAHKARITKHDIKVVQLIPEPGVLALVLPHYLSQWTNRKVNTEGVRTISGAGIKGATIDDKVHLKLSNGDTMDVDHVVLCVGLEPNIDIAPPSNLEIDKVNGGIVTNAELEARSDVWVAGDAGSFYDIKLGRRRLEHHDHAVVSGRLAGENMTGSGKPYRHQSMFWSDLGPNLGFEAIGIIDASLQTVGVFCKQTDTDTPVAFTKETGEPMRSVAEVALEAQQSTDLPDKFPIHVPSNENEQPKDLFQSLKVETDFVKGVVFYLRDDIIVGVLLWNVFGKMPIARKLIRDQVKHADFAEVAKLFEIYGEKDPIETTYK